MAIIGLPFEALLSSTGLSQLKSLLDQVIANSGDTAKISFQHFLNNSDLPFEIPVNVSKQNGEYFIESAIDLVNQETNFLVHDLTSRLNSLQIVLNDTATDVNQLMVTAETELNSLRDRVSNELSKIPFELTIEGSGNSKVFSINQTSQIDSKIQGVNVLLKSSSLTFDTTTLSQLQLSADLLFPNLQNEAGNDIHRTNIDLSYGSGIFNGTASNIPAARLQGFKATLLQLTVIIQNGEFQNGTTVNGEFIFDFLDDVQNGPGKIGFNISLLNNGDVLYEAQNPEGQELKKGSISIFFQQIRVLSHTNASTDIDINGWIQLPGIKDSGTDQIAKTTFELSYADPNFEFTGNNFTPIPLGFGQITFDTVFLRIHKSGTLDASNFNGDLGLPMFNDGLLDFEIQFQSSLLKISVSNPTDKPIKHGDFSLIIDQYEMTYENGNLQNIIGNGELQIPVITSNTPIEVELNFSKDGQNELLNINATNFGTPDLGGCELLFSEIKFEFENGELNNSTLDGRLKIPDTTDGAGIAFNTVISNQGNDYTISLDGNQTDNELNLGPIQLSVQAFQISVVNGNLDTISGNGNMQLPGLNQAFAFSFNVDTSGQDPVYQIDITNVVAEIQGFNLSINSISVSSQSQQQFIASANGSMMLPVFDDGGTLAFNVTFDRNDNYEISVSAGPEFVSFGDFKLSQVAIDLNIQSGILQDFTGSAEIQIPGFNSATGVGVAYNKSLDQHLISLQNAIDVDLFGGALNLSSFDLELLNGSFESCEALGSFKLPDSTGGAGIQFTMDVDSSGNNYTLNLTGTPNQNTLEFGPIALEFHAFSLTVQNNDIQNVNGNGMLQLPGLSQAFAFSISVDLSGNDPVYEIEILNVSAEIEGFNLSFNQISISSQSSQQFDASASGSLTLPIFDDEGSLSFSTAFDRDDNYSISISAGPEFVKFGDFTLSQVAISLEVESGVLQNFAGSAQLQIPGFNSASGVSFNYDRSLDQYLINLQNAIDIDLFGGALHLASFELEIKNKVFEACNASGSFKLPDSTGGLGIQFEIDVDDSGNNYTLQLVGTPDQNTLEFGPVSLEFNLFNLVVASGDVQSVTGSGSLQLPGLNDDFDFNISVDLSGNDPLYIIEILNVSADLNSFQLAFDQIRIESTESVDFAASIDGSLTLPVFSGNPINFDVAVQKTNTYTVQIDGTGQTATFGVVELRDLAFNIEVNNGNVNNAAGSAKLHIPELTESNQPFQVSAAYSSNGNEDFSLSAVDIPPIDLSIFELTISNLGFLIRNGNFENAEIIGSATMPFFTSGGNLSFTFNLDNGGNNYDISISSTGTFSASGLELKDISIAVNIVNGNLSSISGSADFKFPGASTFTSLEVLYNDAQNLLSFSTDSAPPFTLAGLTFNFDQFGFGIQNGNLVNAEFDGSIVIPVFDNENNSLDFDFTLQNGNNYTIEVNKGGGETELKLGDLSLFINEFDLEIINGNLDNITASAGLSYAGFEDENNPGVPARFDISFSYDNPTQKYSISLSQNKKIEIGGFAFTLENLTVSFTPSTMEYPLAFQGKLEIPGLENEEGGQAELGVTFNITAGDSFSGSIDTNDAVFKLGSVHISELEIEVSKVGSVVSIALRGKLSFTEFGEDGSAQKIDVDIEIASDGSFSILGEADPALKVVDLPSVIRIYLSQIGLSRSASNDWDFTIGGLIENLIVIPGMDDLLPNQLNIKELQFGSSFDLDLDIRWPSGLSISFGGSQSEAVIPVNGKFGNAVSLDALKLSFKDNGNLGLELGVAFSGASLNLGPVVAVVDGLGIEAILTKPNFINGVPDGSANFGIVNIDLNFKPPSGLGVSLDTPVFSGGGYLFFDNDKQEYAGALELSVVNMFAVSAIGIINNKMPDGKPGTSVLFIISVEFTPGIALGFGFFLSGLGGMVGIHRTIQVEKLREGVRNDTIQNILFPKNIIANITRIISDIKTVFPIKRDQFIIGPMAAITWGVPTIVRIDLGLAIEFDNPVRFGILGVLRLILPDESAALIKIQVAFLGILDFDKGMLSFDASLFDSKILTFGLEGDMVLRLSWGEKKDFVVSVGGFHPSYTPPTYLQIPTMKRLTIKILSGNPRLTLTSYMAVTTNTVQFGAGIDFYFGVAGFKIIGEFGFDVLFQFSPFRFIADARARLAVKAGSTTLFSISLEFTLEGPTPWRAKGTAKFKILFFTIKAKFNVTWGDERDTALPDIMVLPLLMEAIEDDQNWRSITQSTHIDGMRMLAISEDEDDLVLTPNGTIEILQKVVPLNAEINKFGQFNPADYTKFEVSDVEIGNDDVPYNYVQDDFAPANYLNLGDKDKLALPSFEKQDAGVRISGNSDMNTGSVKDREVHYEQNVMDEIGQSMFVNNIGLAAQFPQAETTFFSRTGAIRRSSVSANKSRVLNPNKIELKEPGYSVVNTDDLEVVENGGNLTFMSAFELLNNSSTQTALNTQVVMNDVLNI